MENARPTLLLVEDDPGDIFLMQRACRKADLISALQIVTDGQMAVDYLAGTGRFADRSRSPLPRVVFLDLKLPYKPGLEVLRWIRTQSALADLIVVVLSSSSEERDRATAYQLGARSFLVKPPTPEMLLAALTQCESCLPPPSGPPAGNQG